MSLMTFSARLICSSLQSSSLSLPPLIASEAIVLESHRFEGGHARPSTAHNPRRAGCSPIIRDDKLVSRLVDAHRLPDGGEPRLPARAMWHSVRMKQSCSRRPVLPSPYSALTTLSPSIAVTSFLKLLLRPGELDDVELCGGLGPTTAKLELHHPHVLLLSHGGQVLGEEV